MITLESFSELLGILGDKEKCTESDEFIYSKKMYRNFHTDAIYFPFEARKETHEQHKTKIDIDEFRSGTTNITQKIKAPKVEKYSYSEYYFLYSVIIILSKL